MSLEMKVMIILFCSYLLTDNDWCTFTDCCSVVVSRGGNQPTKVVPSRPQLPDYYTATKRLAERRAWLMTSESDDVIGRRSRSCDSLATPPERCVQPNESDLSEDGEKCRDFFKVS